MDHQSPTIGRIVLYRLTKEDLPNPKDWNGQKPGDQVPAMIVQVWSPEKPGYVNLKLIPDGPVPAIWKTSIVKGNEPGQWSWPPRA